MASAACFALKGMLHHSPTSTAISSAAQGGCAGLDKLRSVHNFLFVLEYSMQDNRSNLESRVAKLERNNRILTLACIGLPCMVLLLGAKAEDAILKGKRVVAEEFLLTDAEGATRAMLKVDDKNGACLQLIDQSKKTRVLLTAELSGSGGPAVVLLSKNQKPALTAGTNRDSGIGSVDFLDDGVFKGGVGGSALHKK
jgi:hypothetical protein